jgi:hypothetical protein
VEMEECIWVLLSMHLQVDRHALTRLYAHSGESDKTQMKAHEFVRRPRGRYRKAQGAWMNKLKLMSSAEAAGTAAESSQRRGLANPGPRFVHRGPPFIFVRAYETTHVSWSARLDRDHSCLTRILTS